MGTISNELAFKEICFRAHLIGLYSAVIASSNLRICSVGQIAVLYSQALCNTHLLTCVLAWAAGGAQLQGWGWGWGRRRGRRGRRGAPGGAVPLASACGPVAGSQWPLALSASLAPQALCVCGVGCSMLTSLFHANIILVHQQKNLQFTTVFFSAGEY